MPNSQKLKVSEAALIASNAMVLLYALISYRDQLFIIYAFLGENAVICAFVFLKLMVVAFYGARERVRGKARLTFSNELFGHIGFPLSFLITNAILVMISFWVVSGILARRSRGMEWAISINILDLIAIPMLVYTASHLVSFASNFIGLREYGREYGRPGMVPIIKYPFIRMISFAFFGVAAAAMSGPASVSAVLPAVALTIAKTSTDLYYHRREHETGS